MNLMSLKISCRFSGPRIPSNWHPSQPLLQALLAWLSGSASSKAKPCEGRFHPIMLQTIRQINLGLVVFIVLVVQEPDTLIRWRDMKSVRLSWNPKPWPPRIPSFSGGTTSINSTWSTWCLSPQENHSSKEAAASAAWAFFGSGFPSGETCKRQRYQTIYGISWIYLRISHMYHPLCRMWKLYDLVQTRPQTESIQCRICRVYWFYIFYRDMGILV